MSRTTSPTFLSQAAIYTLSNFAVSGVPFLLLPILTRMLEPTDYAIISMFTLVVTVFTIFVGLNIQGSISVRYFDNTTFDMTTYMTSAHYIALITTTIMCAVVYFIGDYIKTYTNIPVGWL
jgi:O-antigen/teichoic acid export membrane protein